jgi:signal transduction histidine kinase/DNA-binding response OmpR family regulator
LRKIAVGPGRSIAAEGALVHTPAEPPAWAWEASPVVFSFATNIPGDEGSIRYRYRLGGLDSDWSDWQTEPVVKLGRIPEGRYTLQVEAIDQQGRISQPAEVSFVIYPPWYRSPLALAAYGLGAMLLIAGLMWGYGLALSRRNHLLEQEVLRRTRDAELAREEAVEASKAKSLFLASMSHEIRTPMNGVLGMTELLMDTGPNEEQQEYINTIRVSGENLLTIINDILDYSKIESGSMELEERPIPIRAWVAEVLELFGEKAARAGLELYAQVHDEVPEVIVGDDTRLRQIVINLINNALKFTEKGQVELVVSMVAPLIPGEDACKLRFEVRDSGIGIPEHKLDRLFKVYSQTDASTARTHGGTGLGLAISQELVILMGGAITVSSKVGQGSTFAFTIQSRVMPETGPAPYVQYALAGIKLLLLDDHSGSRAAQAAQLRRAGADVTEAGSLAEARQILANTTFQAIVTDLEMPGGNGILLAQEMQGRGVPVLLMSTPLHFRPFRTRKDLFTAVISKPVRPDNLLRMVHRAVFQDHNEIAMPQGQHDPAETSRLADEFPLRLLVAEDNAVNQRLITKILAKMGYEVRLASNGAEAVAALRKERYDVVLMDVQMPEMDGLAATKMIRSELAYQPVIVAMTANAMQGDREMCIEAGMNDYVSKPFKQQELIEMLQKYGLEKQIREALQQA